jgi:enoyl-CoA hydratase
VSGPAPETVPGVVPETVPGAAPGAAPGVFPGLVPGTSGETVRTVLDGGVLVVWLDRPESAHARNQVMRDELAALWRATADARAVRAVVLTGSGRKFFCAGMDLREAALREDPVQRRDRLRRGGDVELLASLPQPTVAAINGFALGGGLEMALACDLRLIADHAHVGLPEVTRGLVPAAGGTQRLPRVVGYARACELILSGRRVDAREAVEIGLALRALPADELLAAATGLARQFAANPEPAVRYAKALLKRSQSVPIDVGREAELDAMLTLLGQADLGVTAELRILLRAAYWPHNYVFGARTTCRPSGQRDFQHVC